MKTKNFKKFQICDEIIDGTKFGEFTFLGVTDDQEVYFFLRKDEYSEITNNSLELIKEVLGKKYISLTEIAQEIGLNPTKKIRKIKGYDIVNFAEPSYYGSFPVFGNLKDLEYIKPRIKNILQNLINR